MATKLVSFLLLPLYTSVLSTGDYGTVDYINTIALFCVPAVSLLMDEALFRSSSIVAPMVIGLRP